MKDGMDANSAIETATRNRVGDFYVDDIRIRDAAPGSVFAGSELYRGLGSVVLGGLSLSAVLDGDCTAHGVVTVVMGAANGARRCVQHPSPPIHHERSDTAAYSDKARVW